MSLEVYASVTKEFIPVAPGWELHVDWADEEGVINAEGFRFPLVGWVLNGLGEWLPAMLVKGRVCAYRQQDYTDRVVTVRPTDWEERY